MKPKSIAYTMISERILERTDKFSLHTLLAVCAIGASLYVLPVLFDLAGDPAGPDLIAPAFAQSGRPVVPLVAPALPQLDESAVDARDSVDVWSCRKGC